MSKRITLHDVAREAGVSIKTASVALNSGDGVAFETVLRVRRAAESLGYYRAFNPAALLGAVTPSTNHPAYGQILEIVQEVSAERGVLLGVQDTGADVHREIEAVAEFDRRRVRGVLLISPRMSLDRIFALARPERPIVTINKKMTEAPPGIQPIHADDAGGMRRLVDHLVARGHRRLAYLAGPRDSWSNQEREQAFLQRTLETLGEDAATVVEHDGTSPPGFSAGAKSAGQLVDLEPEKRPTAVIAYSDIMAIGAMRRIHDAGFHIPRDFAVAGFDNLESGAFSIPSLTSVEVPRRKMALRAIKYLLGDSDAADVGGAYKHGGAVLETTLRLRESTAFERELANA